MFEKRFNLEVIAPQQVMYEGEVTTVRAPGVVAPFAVLAGHTPFLSLLEVGEIILRDPSPSTPLPEVEGSKPQYMAISGGILEVLRTGVTILVETAEWADEIDVSRAQSAKERAQQRLARQTPEIDVQRAEAALARALNRLRVAQHAGGFG
ncbi:TPA: F0F1 ATP synthase subunit epsilon [Candidatus Poribacteria bacterium]|nr:F0F1 ATP synthase subunit epsilon [Candidatus Poribacteria bacterium]